MTSFHQFSKNIAKCLTSQNRLTLNLTYPICSTELTDDNHCVKSVRIWSCSGPHFPVFGLNTIQSECGK